MFRGKNAKRPTPPPNQETVWLRLCLRARGVCHATEERIAYRSHLMVYLSSWGVVSLIFKGKTFFDGSSCCSPKYVPDGTLRNNSNTKLPKLVSKDWAEKFPMYSFPRPSPKSVLEKIRGYIFQDKSRERIHIGFLERVSQESSPIVFEKDSELFSQDLLTCYKKAFL